MIRAVFRLRDGPLQHQLIQDVRYYAEGTTDETIASDYYEWVLSTVADRCTMIIEDECDAKDLN